MKLYQTIDKKFTEEFWTLLAPLQKVVIVSHFSPDEDAVASLLITRRIILERFPEKEIVAVLNCKPLERFSFLPDFKHITFTSDLMDVLDASVGGLVCVDGSQLYRFTKAPLEVRSRFSGPVIAIDHHESSSDEFDLALVDTLQPSCANLLYSLFEVESYLTKELAALFLMGILADTGNFSFLQPDKTEIFTLVGHLVKTLGVSIDEFQMQYRAIPLRVFSIIQECVKNTKIHSTNGWPDWQSSFVSQDFINIGNYSDNEVAEAKDIYVGMFLRSLQGITWGIALYPRRAGSCHISGRSLPKSVNVRILFEEMGLGGGHNRAAGGKFAGTPDDPAIPEKVIEIFENYLAAHKPVLE